VVKWTWPKVLPIVLMVAFACTRWPGLFPKEWSNFSAAYALVFCAGVYFPKSLAWWLPLSTLVLSDIGLNLFYYHQPAMSRYMLVNYVMYAALIWLGRRHSPKDPLWRLITGGVAGTLLFFFVTNTVAWLQDDEYAKNFSGWLQALITGVPGWPPPWMFLRNSLLSGGLFTGLFAGAMKLSEAAESAREKEVPEPVEEAEGEPEGEESKA
jgi:uncharacterized protein DUF6580